MAAGNRSPLGFSPIFLFVISVLAAALGLQKLYGVTSPALFFFIVGLIAGAIPFTVWIYHGFVWDVFRSFRCAVLLLAMVIASCILGTFLIQDLDLRRENPPHYFNAKVDLNPNEPFDHNTQSGQFALAEAVALVHLLPDQETKKMLAEKVKLSENEKLQVQERKKVFGAHSAQAWKDAILHQKERDVYQVTTGDFAKRHWKTIHSIYIALRHLHLLDIFESWWFYTLLGLIGVSVAMGTFARAPWNLRDFGLVVTHVGVLIVLLGALTDCIGSKEGYIWFQYGKPMQQFQSVIEDRKNQTDHELPFAVHLDRFKTEYYYEMSVVHFDWNRRSDGSKWGEGEGGGTPFEVWEQYPMRQGVTRLFNEGNKKGAVKITVRKYLPRVRIFPSVTNDPNGPLRPAVKLGLYRGTNRDSNFFLVSNQDPWFFGLDPARSVRELERRRFEYDWARSPDEYRALLHQPPIPDNGTLLVRLGNFTERLPVILGTTREIQIGERSVKIEFRDLTSALAKGEDVNRARKLQHNAEPSLRLRVDGAPIEVRRDDRDFAKGFESLKGLELRFDWPDPKDSGVMDLYRIVEGKNLPRVLVQLDDNRHASVTPLPEGSAVRLGGTLARSDIYLTAEDFVRSAKEGKKIQEISDETFLKSGDVMQNRLIGAWADVEIKGPHGDIRHELTPGGAPIYYPDTSRPEFGITLERTQEARDWFSVLSVIDEQPFHNGHLDPHWKDHVVQTHVVQVNSPLRRSGYRFFQATASVDPDHPRFAMSGISVTYRPGIQLIYLGFFVLVSGVSWLFFLRPVLDRRRRRRRMMEAAA